MKRVAIVRDTKKRLNCDPADDELEAAAALDMGGGGGGGKRRKGEEEEEEKGWAVFARNEGGGRGSEPFYRRTGVYLRGMKRMQRDSHQRLHRPQHPRHQDCFSHSASNSCFTVAVATVAAGP